MKKIFMKQALLIATTLVIAFSLGGCKEKPAPGLNDARGTDYQYDYVNYVQLDTYGANGKAFLEMKPADFSVKDFENESDYISVRKKMDTLLPYLTQGNEVSSYVEVVPNTNLSNGDIVMLKVKDGFTDIETGVTMNLEPFLFVIEGLPEGQKINLFDESSITFYGLNNSDKIYVYKRTGGTLPDEVVNNITYSIKPNSSPLVADSTVLSIEADMNENFLKNEEMPYYTLDTYMTKHDYLYELVADKVLTKIVDPINYQVASPEEIQGALYQHFFEQKLTKNGNEYLLDKIATIQQFIVSTQKIDPYTTMVTMKLRAPDDTTVCARSQVKMVKIDINYVILDASNVELVHDKYCSDKFDGMEIVLNYNEGDTLVDLEEEVQE